MLELSLSDHYGYTFRLFKWIIFWSHIVRINHPLYDHWG